MILLPSILTDEVKFIGGVRSPKSLFILVLSWWNWLSSDDRDVGDCLEVWCLSDVHLDSATFAVARDVDSVGDFEARGGVRNVPDDTLDFDR